MIDVKKLRELSKETRHMAYVASEIGHVGAAEQFIECADAILALCDRLEAMEREREDQNRYLAAQSAEIAGLKQRLAQQPNYCDIHCKKFCQNSVHGMCDGPPEQQPSDECPHRIDDGACKECYHAATDTERLDWVMHRLSGKALRDIGVVYCEGNPAETRANIDAAIDQKGEFSEQQPSGTTSTGSLAFDYAHAEVARKLGIRNPLVSNHQTSGEVMEKRILELADKYRIDYDGDYSRNAKEHELDLLAFSRAVLSASTQELSGLSEFLRNHAIYHESGIAAKSPEVVEHVKQLRAWADALGAMPKSIAQQPSGEVTPLKVERHSDMSVLVIFSSCRQASVFEREIAARAQGGES
ncbi:hypothetical protein [Burkholderia pseudomallei]|uniref:hypothetical protein n=1 Tax=Burkholderia pseudomallei TaxID=28450 RepID=UPI00052A5B20|nr:hypothetical protein [Burkholderia pseudomallei]AIV87110.1 hypothetical protein X995_5190 [Burkholderia pseudomallei B03]AIV92181.1 hypothetical protein X996_5898 [Burkholderia pseudomallei A79A]KGX94450.1 hypothetical protein X997_5884 [Burkholderia pseudomallei A79C]KGX96451.1 hypothetical protein Y023_5065 [Burkholderia pseudomallei A79D]